MESRQFQVVVHNEKGKQIHSSTADSLADAAKVGHAHSTCDRCVVTVKDLHAKPEKQYRVDSHGNPKEITAS